MALFSTTTALLGATGLAHYAAANAFLDATAQARAASGKAGPRVLSVNWGLWNRMRSATEEDRRFYRESGLVPLASDEALDALGALLATDVAQAAVARIDWSVLKPLHEARRPRPLLAGLDATPAPPSAVVVPDAAQAPATGLRERLATLPEAARHEALLELVTRMVAATLGRGADEPVPPRLGLFEMGMDSLMAVELKRRLEQGVGQALPSTLTFNHPNAEALARYLARLLAPQATAPVARPAPPPEDASDALDTLSEDEIEARLLARLEQLG